MLVVRPGRLVSPTARQRECGHARPRRDHPAALRARGGGRGGSRASRRRPTVACGRRSRAKGLLGRLGRRAGPRSRSPRPPRCSSTCRSTGCSLPITGFGNLTTHDAHRVVDAIATAAAGWKAPTAAVRRWHRARLPGRLVGVGQARRRRRRGVEHRARRHAVRRGAGLLRRPPPVPSDAVGGHRHPRRRPALTWRRSSPRSTPSRARPGRADDLPDHRDLRRRARPRSRSSSGSTLPRVARRGARACRRCRAGWCEWTRERP